MDDNQKKLKIQQLEIQKLLKDINDKSKKPNNKKNKSKKPNKKENLKYDLNYQNNENYNSYNDLDDEIKVITIMQQPETDEAITIYNKHRNKNLTILFIGLGAIFIIGMIGSLANSIYFATFGVLILFYIFIAICIYSGIMIKYRQLIKIAKMNDKIRHEERIRYRERKRLEREN